MEKTNKNKYGIGYCRLSQEDKESNSIIEQKSIIVNKAREMNIKILFLAEDIFSGRKAYDKRIGYMNMLSKIDELKKSDTPISYVFVKQIDRLGRNMGESATAYNFLTSFGMELIDCTDSVQSKYIHKTKMYIADIEGEIKKDRICVVLDNRFKNNDGVVYRAKLGYDKTTKTVKGIKRKRLIKNRKEFDFVIEIFNDILLGKDKIEIYNKHKVLGKKLIRKKYVNYTNPSRYSFTYQIFLKILADPIYAGYLTAGKRICKGSHPPAITTENFLKLNPDKEEFLLSCT